MDDIGQYYHDSDKVINCEHLSACDNIDSITKNMAAGETIILDVGNNFFNQADEIYSCLTNQGYDVRKTFRNGRNQLILRNTNNTQSMQ